jgi:hypothetical protein
MKMMPASRVTIAAGLFCAATATLLSAVFVATFFAAPSGAYHNAGDVVKGILVMCLFTAIPAGSFGFLAGVAGSAWLRMRARHFHSRVRLLVESALIGAALSSIFPFFRWAMGWTGGDKEYSVLDLKALLFCVGVGCSCAVLFAIVFGRLFLPNCASDKHTAA